MAPSFDHGHAAQVLTAKMPLAARMDVGQAYLCSGGLTSSPSRDVIAAGGYKVNVKPTSDRGRIAGYHVEGRHVAGVLKTRDDGLGRAHTDRDVRLRQTGRLSGLDHLADDREYRAEAVVLGLDRGVDQ
jgi:hypothetical protein